MADNYSAELLLREITPEDNAAIESVIRSCLIEFGADHDGTAWADPMLGRFSEVYSQEGSRYWVAVYCGRVVGGCGIGRLTDTVCELQKMYLLPEVRGRGFARSLMDKALGFARLHYEQCFLETLENMTAAQRLYEHFGFVRTDEQPVVTEHYACDVRYIKNLR